MKLLRSVIALPVLLALMLSQSSAALAASYTLFGDATLVHPGNASDTAAQLRSVGTSFGGVDFDVPSGTTVSDLTNLQTDYRFTSGSCGGGAPRFQINTTQGNIFVYLGPPPNYTLCAPNVWLPTGNLLLLPVDSSQLGGTFYDTWAHVVAAYGSLTVTGIQLVTDGGWAVGGTQTVLVDNVQINDMLFTFEAEPTKESCKDGGWKDFTSSPGPFKNQGDCVSHFASGGKSD